VARVDLEALRGNVQAIGSLVGNAAVVGVDPATGEPIVRP